MSPAIYESLSAAILAADLYRLWTWAEREGLCEGTERGELTGDEIRDMLLDWSAALRADEAEAMLRALAGD
jgi:hypothetical protein